MGPQDITLVRLTCVQVATLRRSADPLSASPHLSTHASHSTHRAHTSPTAPPFAVASKAVRPVRPPTTK